MGEEARLYLWAAHLNVSLRVAQESGDARDRRWPNPVSYAACWDSSLPQADRRGEVLAHLHDAYFTDAASEDVQVDAAIQKSTIQVSVLAAALAWSFLAYLAH